MPSPFFKSSLPKNILLQTVSTAVVMILGSGCASLVERKPSETLASHNDKNLKNTTHSDSAIDPSNDQLRLKAQAAWEGQEYTASADYHFTLAQAYATDGKVERAIEEYRIALTYDPQSSVLHSRLAVEYLKKGTTTFAIEECRLALDSDPKNTDVRLMLGGIYSNSNQLDLALVEYEAILKIEPTQDEAAVFKTQVLVEKERFAEAIKFIRGFTAKVKDSSAAWYYAGKLEHNQNNWIAAVADYRRALELRPGFSQASLALGMIFEVHGENKKALEVYEAQLEEHQDMQTAGRLATLYLKLNQLDLALRTLNVMKVLDPEDLNTQMKIGLVHMQKERWDQAKEAFLPILEKVPDSDKVNYYVSAVYEEQGDFKRAIDHLEKVGVDSKLFEDANLRISGIYRKMQNKDKALSSLKDAVARSPETVSFYLMLASMYEDRNDNVNATQALADGLKIFPEHERMRYFHGALLDKLGKQDEAIKEMEALIEKNPDNVEALNFIAYSWTTQGVRLKDAEAMLKRALKLKPDSPFILDSMGWNQFLLGHARDALLYLEKAASLKSDESAILEHLAEAYALNQMPEKVETVRARIKKLADEDSRRPASVNTAAETDDNSASEE